MSGGSGSAGGDDLIQAANYDVLQRLSRDEESHEQEGLISSSRQGGQVEGGSDVPAASTERPLPPWMQADKISFAERTEIQIYKCITYIPVLITFGVFIFLFIYYTFVSASAVFSYV